MKRISTKNLNACLSHLVTLVVTLNFTLIGCRDQGNLGLKIIGGTPVSRDNPLGNSVAALVDGHSSIVCTVVAIAPSVFITAAHCTFSRNIEEWAIQAGQNTGFLELLKIDSVKVHPNFTQASMYSLTSDLPANDIAVIRTAMPWTKAVYVKTMSRKNREAIGLPLPLTIIGYGRTNGHRPAIAGPANSADVVVTTEYLQNHEFLSDQSNNIMGCHGDSGGGAFYTDSKTILLAGIISRGDSYCLNGTTVYTDISAFSEFLLQPDSNLPYMVSDH
jgi:secreted trypsin-like serine protease